MTDTEFHTACTKLGITGNELAGELLGVNWRTAQRYWYGELPVPNPVARLLRLAVRLKLNHDQLRALAK